MTDQIRAALYARISDDDLGTGKGIARQLADGRALAEARGWQVVAEHADNDVSALRGALRPGYQAVLQAARAGSIDRVVVWQTSRLLRNRRERAEAIELLQRARVGIAVVKGQDHDLSTASGRGMTGLLGEFDTMESEVKSERVIAAAAQRAKEGRANGAPAYGWRREHDVNASGRVVGFRDVEDPEKAPVVREIVDRLLAGESLLAVTADLNARGIRPPGAGHSARLKRAKDNPAGTRWGKTSVKKLATRPANIGMRVYHRGRPDEQLLPAAWPSIVPKDRHHRVTALLTDPTRTLERPGARQHLLTWGIGECGVCGQHLRVANKGTPGHKKALYVCEAKGCVGRDEARVDDLVRRVVVARLARPDALAWLDGDDTAAASARDLAESLRARLDVAADEYADGRLDARQLERITARLRPLIDAAEAKRRAHAPREHAALVGIAGPAAERAWDGLSLAQRRSVLSVLNVTVRIMPTRPGPGFDPGSVEIGWGTP